MDGVINFSQANQMQNTLVPCKSIEGIHKMYCVGGRECDWATESTESEITTHSNLC